MPRCGQASMRAKASPRGSRPITNGISRRIALTSCERCTRPLGRTRYQKPKSISESGVCFSGTSSSGMASQRQRTTGREQVESTTASAVSEVTLTFVSSQSQDVHCFQ